MSTKKLYPDVHIPIDGGPCAAKTDFFAYLKPRLEAEDIIPLFVEEAARKYFKQYGRSTLWKEQCGIFQLQLDNEAIAREEATRYKNEGKKVIVCYDRSLMTSKAYIPEREWSKLIAHFGMTEKDIARRYTYPIHMRTAADGAREYYRTDPERPESPEEAYEIDLRLRRIWDGHFHFVPDIKNTEKGLPGKLETAWNEVVSAARIYFL